jgi:hypothetical protein
VLLQISRNILDQGKALKDCVGIILVRQIVDLRAVTGRHNQNITRPCIVPNKIEELLGGLFIQGNLLPKSHWGCLIS